ncbi:hypothetical protein PPERSA_09921 [Pseudocohnilembus persalinus]|uniref:RING-type domain-containing protein n=1 Tax=Pseudocohnilembus persalinus TaxID=266149 RepID=A0A0V0QJX6_PSEPJ|nr:hypothetical protein PPERSA_09921 [Pseudocohnilembus persalinus]|eukprot:KRX02304.1 hypothetical protein PPERSA_09921 [Pseudocohnilembus persalinus]
MPQYCRILKDFVFYASQIENIVNSIQKLVEAENVLCYMCGQNINLQILHIHQDKECKNKEMPCEYCAIQFPIDLMSDHLEMCQFKTEFIKTYSKDQEQDIDYEEEKNQNHEFQNRQQDIQNREQGQFNLLSRIGPIIQNLLQDDIQQEDTQQRYQINNPILRLSSFLRSVIHRDYCNDGGLSSDQLNNIVSTKYKKNGEQQSSCNICLCDFEEGEEIKILICIHRFHAKCIDQWISKNTKCPICKTDLKQ